MVECWVCIVQPEDERSVMVGVQRMRMHHEPVLGMSR